MRRALYSFQWVSVNTRQVGKSLPPSGSFSVRGGAGWLAFNSSPANPTIQPFQSHPQGLKLAPCIEMCKPNGVRGRHESFSFLQNVSVLSIGCSLCVKMLLCLSELGCSDATLGKYVFSLPVGVGRGPVDPDENPAVSLRIKLRQTITAVSKAWIADRLVWSSPEVLAYSQPRRHRRRVRSRLPRECAPGAAVERAWIFFQNGCPCPCLVLPLQSLGTEWTSRWGHGLIHARVCPGGLGHFPGLQAVP